MDNPALIIPLALVVLVIVAVLMDILTHSTSTSAEVCDDCPEAECDDCPEEDLPTGPVAPTDPEDEVETTRLLDAPLPEAFPHREILVENGVETYEDLTRVRALTDLDKIGPARAQNILEEIVPEEFRAADEVEVRASYHTQDNVSEE